MSSGGKAYHGRVADVTVDIAAPIDEVYAYLADPANRPAWQSSLRRVEDVVAGQGGEPGGVDASWTDVTAVPGIRPRMRVEHDEPPVRWSESGQWRFVNATLTMRYTPLGDRNTRARAIAHLAVPIVLTPLVVALKVPTPYALRADLRRAARILSDS